MLPVVLMLLVGRAPVGLRGAPRGVGLERAPVGLLERHAGDREWDVPRWVSRAAARDREGRDQQVAGGSLLSAIPSSPAHVARA